mmetsp:Transcript_1703/g.1988  ORF Transcript_1703/g.1988 Transcript_1703/m.1988 type:complete len:283 (-) Transcript_1703:175-1023(-)
MPQPMADVRVPTMDSLHVNAGPWFDNEGEDFDDVMSSPHYDFFDDIFTSEAKRYDTNTNFPAIQKPVSLNITEVNPPSLNAAPVNERKRKRDSTSAKTKSKSTVKQPPKARSKAKVATASKSSASRSKSSPKNASKKPAVARRGSKLNKKAAVKPDCKIEWDSLQIDEETARIVFSTVPKEHIDELLNEGDSPFTRRHVNSGELTDEQKKAIQLVRKRSRAERKSRREKIRRMQVNNLFNELASSLGIDPVTKDMASILTAAISYVDKSRKEIDSLKGRLAR